MGRYILQWAVSRVLDLKNLQNGPRSVSRLPGPEGPPRPLTPVPLPPPVLHVADGVRVQQQVPVQLHRVPEGFLRPSPVGGPLVQAQPPTSSGREAAPARGEGGGGPAGTCTRKGSFSQGSGSGAELPASRSPGCLPGSAGSGCPGDQGQRVAQEPCLRSAPPRLPPPPRCMSLSQLCAPFPRVCGARPTPLAHLPHRHVLETPTAQYVQRLSQGEGSEAVERCPSTHVLFVAFGNSPAQPVQKDTDQTGCMSAGGGRRGGETRRPPSYTGIPGEPRNPTSHVQAWGAPSALRSA